MQVEIPVILTVMKDRNQTEIDLFGITHIEGEPNKFRTNMSVNVGEDAKIRLNERQPIKKAFGIPQEIWFFLSVGSSFGASYAANYLFDKLHRRKDAKLKIGDKEIEIIKDLIEKTIREEFERLRKELEK